MKLKIKRFISLFLLLLFISAITPDVFIHAFTHHEDTVDFHSTSNSFSHQHIHCERLLDELPAFNSTQAISLEAITFLLDTKVIAPILFTEQLFQFHFSSRGPPAPLS